jgi:hypothetical protein
MASSSDAHDTSSAGANGRDHECTSREVTRKMTSRPRHQIITIAGVEDETVSFHPTISHGCSFI